MYNVNIASGILIIGVIFGQLLLSSCSIPCSVLEQILSSEKVISHCHLNRVQLKTIYIVDTTSTFNKCNFSLANKKVIFTRSPPSEKKYNKLKWQPISYPIDKDRIDVFKCIKISKNRYKLILLREIGGNIINCYFSLKGKEVKVEKIELGNM